MKLITRNTVPRLPDVLLSNRSSQAAKKLYICGQVCLPQLLRHNHDLHGMDLNYIVKY